MKRNLWKWWFIWLAIFGVIIAILYFTPDSNHAFLVGFLGANLADKWAGKLTAPH